MNNDYALCGDVMNGNYVLFGLVVRNPYARFVQNFFLCGKLLSGKFWDLVPLALGKAIINQGPGQI